MSTRLNKRGVFIVGAAAVGAAAVAGARAARRAAAARRIAPGRTIVILGAGFAGVNVARELARQLPPSTGARIVLIDRNNFLLFTPMLTEAAGGEIDARDVVSAVDDLEPRIEFRQGRIESVDLRTRTVRLIAGGDQDGVPETPQTFVADHLVLALGSVTNYHGLPGIEEHSLAIKTLGDAAAIRNRVLALVERAAGEPDLNERRALLTVVVAGGGYSGVETMAAVNDLLRDGVRRYASLSPDDVRAILVQPGDRLLPELDGGLAGYAQRELEKRGVAVRLNTEIASAGPGTVQLDGSPTIPTHLLVWAAGVRPSPIVETLDCKRGHHGGVVVDACCRVVDRPGVWAVGDCAEVPRADGKGTYAPTAQNATREGRQAARNICAALAGKEPAPFVYEPVGEMAIVGRHAGVGRLFGMSVSGAPAWALWRLVYLAKMPGLRKRMRIAVDWSLDCLFGRDVSVLPVKPSTQA